jgi:hypothetical protein
VIVGFQLGLQNHVKFVLDVIGVDKGEKEGLVRCTGDQVEIDMGKMEVDLLVWEVCFWSVVELEGHD